MSSQFHSLSVLHTEDHIGGFAKSVYFEVPERLKDIFRWRAGQHLSLRFKLNDVEVRRSYSISSSPLSGDPMRITVKRITGGLVSNHINDHIKSESNVDVMPPFGSFCLDADKNHRRTHYFFGAGSGITPLYSMLHSVISSEPHSVVHLLYGNKNEKKILFKEQLASLREINPQRISVSHVLSSPPLLSSDGYWRKGKIDGAAIESFINEYPPYAQNTQYYICGPGGMNQAVESALKNLDVPGNRIHTENYGSAIEIDNSITGMAATALVTLNGESHKVAIKENQTILEAVRQSGLTPPFSCESGVCGACRATCEEGSVHMRASMALEDAEIKQGAIVTCQSLAVSDKLKIRYG